MAYVDRVLGQGEEKLYVAHRHIIFLLARIVPRILIALLLIVLGIFAKTRIDGVGGTVLLLVLLAVALLPLIQSAFLTIQWRNEEYVVTGRRVIQVHGVFGKHTIDSSLTMINDLLLDQSVWGRMLNFGDLRIVTGNDVGEDMLQGIADPFSFKRALLAAREQATSGAAAITARPDGRATDLGREEIPALIAQLADLRDRGAISDAEFDAKRAELLRRI